MASLSKYDASDFDKRIKYTNYYKLHKSSLNRFSKEKAKIYTLIETRIKGILYSV